MTLVVLNRKHRFTSHFDPTRMTTQRRVMQQRLQHKFAILKGRIIKLVIDEDAFGLKRRVIRNEHLAGGLGLDRDQMPQIRHGQIGEFLEYRKEKGVKVTEERVSAASLRPVQSEFKQERVDEITDEVADYRLFVSRDNRVLDGTHRWLKRKQSGGEVNVRRIDLPVMEAIKFMRSFDGAKFAANTTSQRKESWLSWDDMDWDQRNAIVDRRMERAVWDQVRNTRFSFLPDPAKIKSFARWLTDQFRDLFTNQQEDEVWYKYADEGFKRGAGRAFDETNKKKRLAAQGQGKLDIYQGGREEFLRSAFGRPESVDKIKVLAGRSFDDLKHITADMSVRMTRSLADSLVTGKGVQVAAEGLVKAVGIGMDRARLMAHTELSRAHSEGQLDTFKKLGVESLGVMVEWSTSGRYCNTTEDRKLGGCVCKECAALEGIVVKIDEAQGMIPRHPGCMCSWLAANVGENQDGQKRGKAAVERAIKRSGNDKDWKSISPKRLKATVSPARNAFCPTGVGGGQSNVCSPANAGTGAAVASAPVHAGSGLLIGHTISKRHKGYNYKVTVTQQGFDVTVSNHPLGGFAPGTGTYASLTAAAKAVRGSPTAINGWVFFGQAKPPGLPGVPSQAAPVASAPVPAPIVAPPAIHAASGLVVGSTYTKHYGAHLHTLEVMPNGFRVTDSAGVSTRYSSLSAAAQGVKGNHVPTNGWTFFGIPKPTKSVIPGTTGTAAPPTVTSPTAGLSHPGNTIPFKAEHDWETGKPEPGQLNGIAFSTAPPKFWEHTKDKDVGEPAPLKHIDRVGIMVEEPDGRVWIVQPTNHYGDRKYTVPGGHVEKGLTDQQNALKELWEETGLQAEITGHVGDFEDSNTKINGRLYRAKRIGGAPWDAKIESHIISKATGQPAAESAKVSLVTKDRAAKLLHRTDDLAQMAAIHPIAIDANANGSMMNKLLNGVKPAVKKYEDEKNNARLKTGNSVLHAIQNLRGFNEKPKVVPKASMDALIAKGDHIEMLRGIKGNSAKNLAEKFRTGDNFPGHGCFGSGTYCDSTKGSSNVAKGLYGGHGSGAVLRMAIPKSAKIIEQSELEKKVRGTPRGFQGYSGGHGANSCWPGVQAALAGYDAIHIDGNSSRHGTYGNDNRRKDEGFYIILNRSIVTVQKEDAMGHRIQ